MRNILKSWFGRTGLLALVMGLMATAASAETLLMPKRDALKGTSLVVWGATSQANGTAFSLDYGDGTPVFNGNVADRSYINFNHTYASAGNFDVVLTVGAESATVKVQVFDPALTTADNLRSLKINMAIEDGLRYFWQRQSNRAGNFPANVYTHWDGDVVADSALIVLAFENHGYKLSGSSAPTGIYEKYIVRRGLNMIMANLASITLSAQTAGNPCVGSGTGWVGSDCLGFTATNDPGYSTAVAMLPFAASGALGRVNTESSGPTAGRTFGEILQRLVNAEAWGQSDSNCGAGRGGFGYNHNGCQFDGSTVGWSILGFLDAEAAGATVPAFVRTEFAFGFNNALNTDGSFDYSADGSPNSQSSPGPHKVGIGLQGLFFLSDSGARVNLVKTNINSWWDHLDAVPNIGPANWGCSNVDALNWNKGCAYSMFNNFKGLKLNGITTLPAVARPAGPGTQPAGDWYADYQDWLVANQTSPNTPGGGYWGTMNFSCCNHRSDFRNISAAVAELILSPVALVLPDETKFSTVGLTPFTNTLVEGGTHTVTAKAESTGGTPVPGATVVFTILSGPNAGLTGTDTTDSNGLATFTYTDGGPLGTIGTDKIQASIGSLDSNIVDMIWIPLNSPPVATDNNYATSEDTLLTGNAVTDAPADSDADAGDTLTASLVSGTTNGTLGLNGDGSFSYSPNANYCGPDSFTYKVNDGTVDSNVATVTIDVVCVNDPPVANPDHKVTPEDTPVSGAVTSSDVDGGAPVYSLATVPSHGTVVVNADGSYTYSPALNYNGPDSFTYSVSDGNGGTATATVTIDVTPVNDAPVCELTPSVAQIWPPNHKMVDVTANGATDVDGDTVTMTVTSITQDESTNTVGDGNTPVDGAGIGTSTASVRAERSGTPKVPGNGRVYHISFTGNDGNGGSCSATVKVGVPHDQGQRRIPVDDGPKFNSVTGAALP